jgi:SAM-dependent methyltransferase
MSTTTLEPSPDRLQELVHRKFGGDPDRFGWGTRMRLRHGYFSPDEVYEATVDHLITPGARWLEVGCGRDVFPDNRPLAQELADRCAQLVGVDPDPTLEENPFVHQRVRYPIEAYQADDPFDVVTLRMVAEHIIDPDAAVSALARLTRSGGVVVVYTVNQWSPVSLVARAVPFALHHLIKHRLWRSHEEDTFPVAYLMNTRRRLHRLFERHGFREASFAYLGDCRTFANTRPLQAMELWAWRALRAVGLTYPENCLLATYERLPRPS